MFKLENNPEKDNKIIEKFDKLTNQLKNNRGMAFTLFLVIIFLAIFGEKILGNWFSDIAEFLQGISMMIVFIGYASLKSKKTLKSEDKKDYLFKSGNLLNLEKKFYNSFGKNISDSLVDYEDNQQGIVKDFLDIKDTSYKKLSSKYDIHQSNDTEFISGEWKMRFQVLILLGILLGIYFTFVK